MKSKYILTVFISFLYFTSWSQTAFQRLYGSGIETGYSVQELQDGYLIMGSTGELEFSLMFI
ncbi:MAG: hypothetical protein IPP71_22065 [Bacteroidetes bacterium]|nr:hypothetical protein [Bacteroidota bacterium]